MNQPQPIDKAAAMAAIRNEIDHLTESPLYEYRTANGYQPVIGAGSLDAAIVFIGEAPGKQEASSGKPFVGASGRILDELLESIGLSREEVYITNVVKDRPPNNRDPRPAEIALYSPFLVRQLAIIQPRIIAPLGRFAMDFALNLFHLPQAGGKISQLHGQPIPARTSYGEIKIIPLYHLAVLYSRGAETRCCGCSFSGFLWSGSLIGAAVVLGLSK